MESKEGEKAIRLNGYVTFRWADGHEQRVKFYRGLKGIQHKRGRPISYTVNIFDGAIDEVDAAKLNEWLSNIPLVLER